MPLNPAQLELDIDDMLETLSGRSDDRAIVRKEFAQKLGGIIHNYVISATVTVSGTTASACTAGGAAGTCAATGSLS